MVSEQRQVQKDPLVIREVMKEVFDNIKHLDTVLAVGIGQRNKTEHIVVVVSDHIKDSFIPKKYKHFNIIKKQIKDIQINQVTIAKPA